MSHTPTTQRVITCPFVVYGTDFLIISVPWHAIPVTPHCTHYVRLCEVGNNADNQRAKGTLPFTAVRPYPRLRPKIGLVWGYWDFVPLARLHDMHSVSNQNYKDLFGVI